MNNPDTPDEVIEKALAELNPAPVPPVLRRRLEACEPTYSPRFAPSQRSVPSWVQLLVRFAIPVIAIAFIAKWWPLESPQAVVPPIAHVAPTAPALQYTPVETNRYVLDAEELALIPGPDERPVQLMRVRTVDYEVSRAQDGSELFVTSQQEKIIPVSLKYY